MKHCLIEFNNTNNGNYHIKDLEGYISIYQESKSTNPVYIVDITGLQPNKLHGFHIHENPVTNKDDLELTCHSCGGHFNPFYTNHGSIFNKDKNNRHAGDLINNLKADENGRCYVEFTDKLTSLYESEINCILNKSIVIHQDIDDLGRQGLDKHIPYLITTDNLNIIKHKSHLESNILYDSKKKRQSSLINGNAGRRIACANIILK
jgi:Cu-Zn family superoxide dismutase